MAIKIDELKEELIGKTVPRPISRGTISGHVAGEPFDKYVYEILEESYGDNVFRHYEYLNKLYLNNPKSKSVEDRMNLIHNHVLRFLLNRGVGPVRSWTPSDLFEEKQNDTADIIAVSDQKFQLLDIKTRNSEKKAQPPNIISAYKLAQACYIALENDEHDSFDLTYLEIGWFDDMANKVLECVDVSFANLFLEKPSSLYINWAAAMQIQFRVSELKQDYQGSKKEWMKDYLNAYVESTENRIRTMEQKFKTPFMKYVDE